MNGSTGTLTGAPDEAEPQLEFSDVFSLRKPKDAKAGVSSGLKSLGKGVLAGAVGLVAAPAVGAHQEGLAGFAKGLGAGIAGAVVLPITGAAVGIAQIGRGIANTPEAIRETQKGKQWDQEKREWVDEPMLALTLDDPMFKPLREQWRGLGGSGRGAGTVDYYELLGVERDADADLIKKQYYTLARKLHPDKNPDDPNAKARFQQLGEAYQVLCNEELRKRYHQNGAEGLDVNFMDGAAFFTMLFGSDKFEHLVGELVIASAAHNGSSLNLAQMKKVQVAREARLEVMLKALLRRWVEGDEQGFKESMHMEAESLASASFGDTMLHTIGAVYETQAQIYLGNFFEGAMLTLRQKGQSLKSQVAAAGMAIKLMQAHQQLERLDREFERRQTEIPVSSPPHVNSMEDMDRASFQSEAGPSGAYSSAYSSAPANSTPQQLARDAAAKNLEHLKERARLEEAQLPLMLDAMWAANVLDIETTLRHVCRSVLTEASVAKATRKARAQALLVLGQIFQNTKSSAMDSAEVASAKQRMEEAMMQVVEKRMNDDAR